MYTLPHEEHKYITYNYYYIHKIPIENDHNQTHRYRTNVYLVKIYISKKKKYIKFWKGYVYNTYDINYYIITWIIT